MSAFLTRRNMIGATVGAAAAALAAKAVAQENMGHEMNMDVVPGGRNDPKLAQGRIPVAFLLDDACDLMDFGGPWEVFQDVVMAGATGYYPYIVAPQLRSYDTSGAMAMDPDGHRIKGIAFTPDYTVDNAPQPQVVIIPAQLRFGGKEKLAWLQKVAPKAEVIMPTCTGNFLAGYAGILDGLKATTHHRYYDSFEKTFPRVELIRNQRFVDSGKIVSGGGITAGIDAALHVIRRHFDDKVVQGTIDYMEYRAVA